MLREVLETIAAGNLGNALTRLWMLAEGSEDGSQRLSRWLRSWDRREHEARVRAYADILDRSPGRLPHDAANHPLALIEALDGHLAERRSLAVVAASAAPALDIDGRRHHLLRRIVARTGKPAAEARSPNLEAWFRHFRVVPDSIEVGGARIDVKLEFLACVPHAPLPDRAGLRLRLSHFVDGAVLDLQESAENLSFVVAGANPAQARRKSLEAELQAVRQDAAHLWLAPELTVSTGLRRQVERWLASGPMPDLLLCVPGSCHEEEGGKRVNRAVVVDGNGRRRANQDKCSQFSYPSADGYLRENIEAKRCLTLLVTPIGSVGIAICKDHFDATAEGLVRAAWDRLAPDWLLVPSMGDEKTRTAHERRAKENWDVRRTCTLVANQEPRMAGDNPASVPGFVRRADAVEAVSPGGSSLTPPAGEKPPACGRGRPSLKRIK